MISNGSFIQHFKCSSKDLKPEEPSHNIISISGQGGVGKSTLITHLMEEVNSDTFKDYCFAILVNERQTTPASIMEKFANQLHIIGLPLKDFEEALSDYKEALGRMQAKREAKQETFLRGTIDAIGSVAEEVPFLGGLLHQGANTFTDLVLEKERARQLLSDVKLLEDPVRNLTKTFVEGITRTNQ